MGVAVQTKFGAFYVGESYSFEKQERKRWMKIKNCWRVNSKSRLFYHICNVNMRYVANYKEFNGNVESITLSELKKLFRG